ncbi:GbsR/MarR family transcriptional regulator [Paralimibaculum aggregatum]|uniref:HTH-type transcriptional regulator n=1 Tax=Paralimibaculum aggregatum TaxID=3036245 RepID=A0ABQ6LIG1_9RHOB|nr:MarR family transcriptional regulator [Limibaculum sp. NKW23]GMG83073.1 GbsR/MarR family transcriptional regulator [Limibaculum sp. NKW23]
MQLTPAMRDFILHWGEMGARWGVNRSVAQIHALLHLAERPLPAEEIAETLNMARSNVSTGLRELQSWRLVQVSRQLGDRRDHFTSVEDMLDLVRRVVEGRRAREYAPTVEAVRETLAAAEADGTPARVVARIRGTLEVMEMFDRWYSEMARLPQGTQLTLLRMGARIARLLPKAAE